MNEWGDFLKTKKGHAPSDLKIDKKELEKFVFKHGKKISIDDNNLIYNKWPQDVKNGYKPHHAYCLDTTGLKKLLELYSSTLDGLLEDLIQNPPQYPCPDSAFSEEEPYALDTVEHNGKKLTMDLYFEEFRDAWVLYQSMFDLKEEVSKNGALYSIFLTGKIAWA